MSPSGAPSHTFGPTCAFYKPPHETSSLTPPVARAQFFYNSLRPIDDPISPVPIPVSGSTNVSKYPTRPFSSYDNAALEETWLELTNGGPKKEHGNRHDGQKIAVRVSGAADAISDPAHYDEHGQRHQSKDMNLEAPAAEGTKEVTHRKWPKSKKKVSRLAKGHISGDGELNSSPTGEQEHSDSTGSSLRRRFTSHFKAREGSKVSELQFKHCESGSPALKAQLSEPNVYGTSPSETDTTGTPFVRAPSRLDRSRPATGAGLANENEATQVDGGDEHAEQTSTGQTSPSRPSSRSSSRSSAYRSNPNSRSRSRSQPHHPLQAQKYNNHEATVPVGVSRLHLVRFPAMQMVPIYWSTVHDVASVVRGTWFYQDSYLPVEPEVANRLEEGYQELKPWTETWNDELNCAVEVGAEGELKITHRLYPEGAPKPADANGSSNPSGEQTETNEVCSDERCAERLHSSHAASHGKQSANTTQPRANANYSNASVIYLDFEKAFILRPNLLPSPYYSRRPLASIRKGKVVGIPVVRGFDWRAWERLHPPRRPVTAIRAQGGGKAMQSSPADVDSGVKCEECFKREERPKFTDLILVIHGIGQKLSERVESFNFTHAISSLRRTISVEMRTEYVKQHMRSDLGGIMVLPVNWRSALSFEDGGPPPVPVGGEPDPTTNYFTLSDITPETIPAVRNLISDVMLDIPYYLSHHKRHMVKAVTMEANRIYQLWCKNNPDFNKTGRVHLIAHSLGSAMALDILSNQPTKLPKENRNFNRKAMSERLLFDTKSLFLVGSPAGFFLLLNRKCLIPRKGRDKADMDGEDAGKGIAGDAGTYGCLAIDNLYNVMHLSDPVTYRLNAAVDCEYASSIKTALIPSASTTFLESVSNAIKSINPISSAVGDGQRLKPSAARLPSVVEMETHNFTREEIAEKRMYLLNDNGQIDWFLSTGTGPLEIQYLNMLGAHSSYWYSRDFSRFLCLEVGRKPGKTNTLVNMRPAKNPFKK